MRLEERDWRFKARVVRFKKGLGGVIKRAGGLEKRITLLTIL